MKKRWIIILLLTIVTITAIYFISDTKLKSDNVIGEALIGGNFTLVDQYSNQRQDTDFRGKYMLVFFGFTHCPNICPTNLFIISEVMKLLGKDSEKLIPIFITIDPERDTSTIIADYLSNFHPSLVGLTGSNVQVEQVAKAYRIYYAKVRDENSALEYTMDHSTFTYLMDKKGKYITHFHHNSKVDDMANIIKKHLKNF